MAYRWIPILGHFMHEGDTIVFKGGSRPLDDGTVVANVGNYICDQFFGGGEISGEVEFVSSSERMVCEFVLYFDPATQAFVAAGLGWGGDLCAVRAWTGRGGQSVTYASVGNPTPLEPGRPYRLKVKARGSRVTVTIDDVNALVSTLPFTLPVGQAGIWAMSGSDIRISNYQVVRERPKVFVVMQYTPPYNELYSDVIVSVCKEFGLDTLRSDETYGPGLIIADIVREIVEANLIIAEVTPANRNVYYEVGYAHALNKPTILIAEKPTQLPFDVSPFRVLFYENTIGGKAKVEGGLRKHLQAIQTQWLNT